MDNQQERLELNIHWFAGFFEAEGWISLMATKRKEKGEKIIRYVPTCGICNTDFSILEKIQMFLFDNSMNYQLMIREPRKEGYKRGWQINLSGMDKCILFLLLIIPYMMGEKKIKAEKVLKFCEIRRSRTKGYFYGMPYSPEEIQLYNEISSKILNDYTPNTAR